VTQFKYKFTDHKRRVRYEGTDLRQLTLTLTNMYTMTLDDLVDLGDKVQAEWKKLAQSSSEIQEPNNTWRKTDYRQQYMSGIKPWQLRENSIAFRLIGAEANAVEHGWAPPTSSEWADGIGQYDGNYHDLRTWLLHSGHPSVKVAGSNSADSEEAGGSVEPQSKKTRSGASVYRILKFDAPALSQIIEETSAHMLAMENAEAVVKQQQAMSEREAERFIKRKKRELRHTARSNISMDKNGNIQFKPIDFSELAPSPDAYGEHVKWVYHQAYMNQETKTFKDMNQAMRHVMHKAKFTVFLTITDSEKQKSRKLFYSKGIKPAKLMSEPDSPLVDIVRKAIINALSAKTVDGRDKDGS
jgi:hypothetical protein